uniref:Uncharacterized protein n=1 Tax=Scleropages formosus TaxID=113540 RepID=A0A8C9SQI5_SCLFO
MQNGTNHTTQVCSACYSPLLDEFFSLLSHVQSGRMEEQRCVLASKDGGPSDLDHLFGLVANTQRCRLDDQRASMSASLPGLHVVSVSHLNGLVKMETGQKTSQLVVGVKIFTDTRKCTWFCFGEVCAWMWMRR